jgi:large subunit ribosomal protein L5
MADKYIPRLKTQYKEKVSKALQDEFQYKSVMQIPSVEKIIVSAGVGEALTNKKLLDSTVKELSQITGQKAVKTKAKKSVANFKLRDGKRSVPWLPCGATICMSSLIV